MLHRFLILMAKLLHQQLFDIAQDIIIIQIVSSMNVDIDNFHEARSLIRELKLIEKSEYVSFDLQFTGVKFENNVRERNDMFLNEKYHKMSAVASKFNIIQIGITFIIEDPKEKDQFIAYPFNFYVFPRETFLADPVISLQAGCVNFNNEHEMDWNRWIKKGINFIKIADIDKVRNRDSKTFGEFIEVLDEVHRDTVLNIIEEVKKCKLGESKIFDVVRFMNYSFKKAIEKYAQEHEIFVDISILQDPEVQNEGTVKMNIRRMDKQQYLLDLDKKEEFLIGFTLLFEQLWTQKEKTIKFIGHNCLYDILFIYESFVNTLPNQYNNFKQVIKHGKQFYDTKYMISQMPEKDKIFPKGTSLQAVFKFYYNSQHENKVLKLAPGFQIYDLKSQVLHEAGFDSYLTAWAFFQVQPSVNLKACEGKFNIFKSYYFMDIRSNSDGVNQDIVVFVIQVAAYNKIIPLDELRRLKSKESKKVKNLLSKDDNLKYFQVNEGLKQIYIHSKQKAYNSLLVKLMTKFTRQKELFGVKSLCEWISFKSGSDQNKQSSL